MFQKLLSAAVLALGLIYAAVILRALYKNKRAFDEANGCLLVTGICEFAVFAISCFGISDFLMNTLAAKRFRLADDKELPPSLVVCTVVPSSIIASRLIAGSESFGLSTLLICGGAVMLGSAAGSRIVTGLDGAKIKSIMRAALIASLGFLIVKMILSSGAPGTLTELSGARLAAAAVICFFCGVLNMFGIPMKPTWTALFMIMGLSPISVLTMVLVLGALAPLSGAAGLIRAGIYQKKMAGSAVIAGSAGALLGTSLAVSIPQTLLNVILIAVMLIAIASMFKKS